MPTSLMALGTAQRSSSTTTLNEDDEVDTPRSEAKLTEEARVVVARLDTLG